jgi:hypothetical protein
MTTFVLEYGDGPREVALSTAEELDTWLDRITAEAERAQRPELATLYDDTGRSLAIGVGARLSLLAWTESDYVLSDGGDRTRDGEAKFFYGNQYSYFPSTALIPVAVAREAMRQFITADVRPDIVRWQNP